MKFKIEKIIAIIFVIALLAYIYWTDVDIRERNEILGDWLLCRSECEDRGYNRSATGDNGEFYFCVCQSNESIAQETIWKRKI